MKQAIIFLLLTVYFSSYSQTEGQDFCEEFKNENYFPLTIKAKKVLWADAFYFEKIVGTKKINNKEYIEYSQVWKAGNKETMYLREENGIVYQFEECCESDTVRFNKDFKAGDSWKTADKNATYVIETLNGVLKTPYCNYKNLVVVKAELINAAFKFYYKKGYGYIGATDVNNNLISCVTPEWD